MEQSAACRVEREVNVGEIERGVSLVLGGALAMKALRRMDVSSLVLAAIGAGLIVRGVTGHCGLYQLLGQRNARQETPARPGRRQQTTDGMDEDIVGEASLESFPASDAPAWTSTTSMPMPARSPRVGS